MRIFVMAKPNATAERVEQIDEAHFTVAVKEPPRDGLANRAIATALARYVGEPVSRLRLVSGYSSRKKVFEIL